MKRIFGFILISCLILAKPVLADDIDSSSEGIGDLMKQTNIIENAFVGQKKVTDEDFQKALQEVKAKQKKGKKPKEFKGKNFNEENNGGYLKETASKNLILSVPLDLTNGDGTHIPIGHYKIVGKKVNNEVYLDFYQSSSLIAKVPAIETKSDFDNLELNFVQLIPYNEKRVKVIYGSTDFNAYTFIKITDFDKK